MTPEQRPINYYDILGVAQNATTEEIKAAYRARMAAYHPDHNPSTHATAVAALVNEAWHTLNDPERRRRYDPAMGFSERARPRPTRSPEEKPESAPTPEPPRAAGGPPTGSQWRILGVFSRRRVVVTSGAALSFGLLFAASRGFQTRVQQKPPTNAIATPTPPQTGSTSVSRPQIAEPYIGAYMRRLSFLISAELDAGLEALKAAHRTSEAERIRALTAYFSEKVLATKPARTRQPRRTANGETREMGLNSGVDVHPHTSSTAQARTSGLPSEIRVIPAPARKDAYDFALALIEGMSAYIDAEERVQAHAPGTLGASHVNAIAALRTAQSQWRSAQMFLNRFESSQDMLVAKLAERLTRSYGAMSNLYGRRVALFEAMRRDSTPKAADVTIEGKLQSEADQVWRSIAGATGDATIALVDLKREDTKGHAIYLKITRAEKADIAKRLGSLAGPSPDDTSKDEARSTPRIGAVRLWRWIKQPACRGSDE
jgi:hypothetical protein